jgi:hypothetical protein
MTDDAAALTDDAAALTDDAAAAMRAGGQARLRELRTIPRHHCKNAHRP